MKMLQTIPTFYKPKASTTPTIRGAGNDDIERARQQRQREAFLVKKQIQAKLEDEHFQLLLQKLVQLSYPRDGLMSLDGKTITFKDFMSLHDDDELHLVFRQEIFTPCKYWMFPKTIDGQVYSDSAFTCAAEMRDRRRVRFDLFAFDKTNTGFLKELDLVQYFSPFLTSAIISSEDIRPYYVAVIVRKFMFLLEPLENEGRIAIKDLINSPILTEFYQGYKGTLASFNWFSPDNVYFLYNSFLRLDLDGNMYLSKTEFANFHLFLDAAEGGELPKVSSLIVDRVFCSKFRKSSEEQEEAEMDFRNFLNFVLAYQNKSHVRGLRYYWPLLDINGVGYLSRFDIRTLVKDVFDTLTEETLRLYAGQDIALDDVQNEVFDMARPKDPERITLEDLIKCNQTDTIVSILTDPSGFLVYEQREMRLAGQNSSGNGTGGSNQASSSAYAQAADSIFGEGPSALGEDIINDDYNQPEMMDNETYRDEGGEDYEV